MSTFLLAMFGLSCHKSVEPSEYSTLDLSKITTTGSGPHDYIRDIDTTDWDNSSYSEILVCNSFWIHKSGATDTLFFSVRNEGEQSQAELQVFNIASSSIIVNSNLLSPFSSSSFPKTIPAGHSDSIIIIFTLPDTITNIYVARVVLRCSNGDSIPFVLKAFRAIGPDPIFSGYKVPIKGLLPAYPNPSNGSITFNFIIAQSGQATFKIIDLKSNTIALLTDSTYLPGSYSITWPASVTNGYYRAIFQSGNYSSKGDIGIFR